MCMNFRLLSVLAAIISSTFCQSSFYNGEDPQYQQHSKFKCIEEGYHPDPKDCRVYYRCVDWGNTSPLTTFRFECGVGTVFSKNKGNICVHPNESERPECGDLQNEIDPDGQESQQSSSTNSGISVSGGYRSTTSTSLSSTSNQLDVNEKYGTRINQCNQEGFMEDSKDCKKFYRCVKEGSDKYVKYEFTCGTGTVWDQQIQGCNHPWAVSRKECQNSNEISSIEGQGNGDGSTVESYPGEAGQPSYPNQPNEPDYPSQPDEPTYPNQPAQPSYPNQPNEPDYPSQPDESTYPNQPGQPSYPNEPNEPAYPSQPNEPTYPGQPGQPSYPSKPDEPTYPSQSGQPSYPNQPNEPDYPSQPDEPTYPNQPGQPSYPNHPNEPAYPSQPDNPNNPSQSGKPSYPNQPTEPNYPEQSTQSSYPSQPNEPAYPSQPDNPNYPSPSGQPSYPNQPNKPAYPGQTDDPNDLNSTGPPNAPSSSLLPPTSEAYEPSSSYLPTTSQPGSTPGMLGLSSTESNSIRPEQNEGANVPGNCSQEGFFPDPQDCRKFYRCVADGSKYTKYEFECGTGTGWDSELQTCNHLHALPNCKTGTDTSGNNEESDPSSNEINSTKQPNDQKPTKIPLQPTVSTMAPGGSSTISGADNIMSTSSQATTGTTSITSSLPPKVSPTYIPSNTAGSSTPSTEISTTTSSTLGSTPLTAGLSSSTSPQSSPQTPESETSTPTTQGTGQTTSTTRSSSSTLSPTESTNSERIDCQEDGFFPNKNDCKKFYRCVKDASGYRKFDFDCGPGTAWDQGLQTCNYISQVASCQATNQDQQGISPSSQPPISGAPPTMTSSTPDKNNDKPDTDTQQPAISSTPSITDDKPASEKPETITVPTDSSSESSSSSTSMSESSSSTSSSSSESSSSSSSTSESSSSTSESSSSMSESSSTMSESSSSTSESSSPTSNPSESSDSSSSKPSSEKPDCSTPKPNNTIVCNTPGFYAHPTRCDKFYRCVDNGNGFNVYHFDCAPGTIFDPSISVCNYPESVYPARDCSSEQQPSTGNSDSPSSTSASTPTISETPATSTEPMTESGSTLNPIESTTSEETSGSQESTPSSETTGPSMETTSSETSTTEPSSESTTSEPGSESTEMSTDTSSDATSQTEDGSMTTEASSMTTETGSMTTESSLTTESAEQASTDSGMTDQSQATTEMSSETTTSQESTTATEGTQETTEKPPDSTEQSTTGSQDSTTESQEMTSDSTTPQEPGFANCPIAANLTDEQVLLVCPTGFRRHPKFCNILYQCTSEGNMEIKIVTLSCPENTIFDDLKVQCVPEAESSQPCMTSTTNARFYRQLEENSLAPVKISTQSLCPSEGHYPFREGCSNAFYKCKNNSRGSLQGYLYKCPKDFVYWSVSRRCERATRLPMCTRLGNTTESNSWETRWEVPIEDHNLSARMLHFN